MPQLKSSSCFCLLFFFLLFHQFSQAQDKPVSLEDTVVAKEKLQKEMAQQKSADTTQKKKKGESGKAALRSAIVPGWGQAYNKKFWKVPIVYGALAIPVVTFAYNLEWYNKTKFAYNARYKASLPPPDTDSSDLDDIDPQLEPLTTDAIRLYRNDFRRNMDYSILAFVLIWGLNIVDAAVDGHLKEFDISEDLSLKIKPYLSPTLRGGGASFVFTIGRNHPKTITSLR